MNTNKIGIGIGIVGEYACHTDRIYTATICGHETRRIDWIDSFGYRRLAEVPLICEETESVDFCTDCIAEMTVLCVKCQSPIFIGDKVVFRVMSPEEDVLKYSVVTEEGARKFLACVGSECFDLSCYSPEDQAYLNQNSFKWLPCRIPDENGKFHGQFTLVNFALWTDEEIDRMIGAPRPPWHMP